MTVRAPHDATRDCFSISELIVCSRSTDLELVEIVPREHVAECDLRAACRSDSQIAADPRRSDRADPVPGEAFGQRGEQALLRHRRSLEHGGDAVHVDATLVGDVDHFVQIAGLVLDVGRSVRCHRFVKPRLVIEAGEHGNRSRPFQLEPGTV